MANPEAFAVAAAPAADTAAAAAAPAEEEKKEEEEEEDDDMVSIRISFHDIPCLMTFSLGLRSFRLSRSHMYHLDIPAHVMLCIVSHVNLIRSAFTLNWLKFLSFAILRSYDTKFS